MTKAESAASRTPRTDLATFTTRELNQMRRGLCANEYDAGELRYVKPEFARTLELEAADLRSENNQLRRLIEKGRDSNATELGLSAQVDTYRDGAVKLLKQVEEANTTIKDLRERLAKAREGGEDE